MGAALAKKVPFRTFSPEEHRTWGLLFREQAKKRDEQIWYPFSDGIRALDFTEAGIPDLHEVNRRLRALTGFEGVPVEGFEEPESFYEMLAERAFPIGYFIRDPKDLGYTPAPDIFHDLYGHLPFLVNKEYADFCQEIGRRTVKFRNDPEFLRQWERLFWFTIEFGLLETPQGRRIFGGGIASSINECAYSLSDRPEVLPFDLETIRQQEFDISIMQPRIFLLKSPEQLYGCLDAFEAGCKR
jgi:phenylalanine-4-hydroxylase